MSATILRTLFGCRHERLSASALTLALTIILASCGGTSGRGGNGEPMPTATLTISPSTIVAGQTFTLNWTSSNGESGTINNGVGQVGLGPGSTSFTQGTTGYPTGTTTYTYTVTGPGGTATASATVTVNLITSFDGMIQSDFSGTGNDQDVDANGAVGTHQYMEYINASYQVYDKITNQPLFQKAKLINTLWSYNPQDPCYLGGNGTSSAIQLDVVILFDRLASPGRWVVVGHTSQANNYYLCIAVSSTDDFTSSTFTWSAYSYKLEQNLGMDGTTYDLPDWPKVGTWPDGYYVAMDEVDQVLNQEVGVVVCVMDRADLLNPPQPPATIKAPGCATIPANASTDLYLSHSLIPADVDGTMPPPTGRDEFMVSIQNPPNDGVSTTSNTLNLWDFHIDWSSNPGLLTYTQIPVSLAPPGYTPGCYTTNSPSLTNCVPEIPAGPGEPELVDSVGDRLMPRFAYRNFGNYESFLVSQTVQTGAGPGTGENGQQTGIQWYEFRDSGSGTPALNQSGKINPDNVFFRFLPSIAEDKDGNAAVGYSFSNGNNDPGINVAFWNLGQASAKPTELTIIQGQGEEVTPGTGIGKWGSYSSMTVDPTDDCTFWYVNEYFVADNTWRTRIANFAIPGCQ